MEVTNFIHFKKQFEQYKIILEEWIPEDASIAIALKNKYIYYSPSNHHADLEIGIDVHPNSIAAKVLSTKQKTEALMDESLFNVPYFAIGYPIDIEGETGALIIILPSTYVPKTVTPIQFLTGKQNEDICPIPVRDITYIESLQKKTWFYSNGEQYKTSITLKELQEKLPNYFIRIHRSYIINIYFIKKISKDITSNYIVKLKDGKELPISSSYINDLRSLLKF